MYNPDRPCTNSEERLDFADAEEDPATGEQCFTVTRRICLANPPTTQPQLQQPCLTPGCNCAADEHCTNATAPSCVDCRCQPRTGVQFNRHLGFRVGLGDKFKVNLTAK